MESLLSSFYYNAILRYRAIGREDARNKYVSLYCIVVVFCFSHSHKPYACSDMIQKLEAGMLENGCIAEQ